MCHTQDYCQTCVEKTGGSCCTWPYPYPTIDDLRLMSLVLSEEEILDSLDLLPVSDKFLEEIQNGERNKDDLLLTVIDEDDERHKIFLKKIPDEKFGERCHFLEDGKGCKLGAFRPVCCRIYPFVYQTDVYAKYGCRLILDDECTAYHEGLDVHTALTYLNTNYQRVLTEWTLYAASTKEHGKFISIFSDGANLIDDFIPQIVRHAIETKDRCRFAQIAFEGVDTSYEFRTLDDAVHRLAKEYLTGNK